MIIEQKKPLWVSRIITALENNINNIYLASGRDSGKTKNAIDLVINLLLSNPKTDAVAVRASYGSMGDSLYNEFASVIEDFPTPLKKQFKMKRNPLRIERKNMNVIYFIGAGGDLERTKGFKPIHPIKVILIEETQELRTKEHYDNMLISLRRNTAPNPVVFTLGNPPNIDAHWFNQLIRQKEQEKDCLVLKPTWLDILPFLKDYDIKEILKTKYTDIDYYNFAYMGVPTGGLGKVYPMFRKDIHLFNYENRQTNKVIQDFQIVGVIIGVDGAVNNDATACVPCFIMSNGQTAIGKIFYHDPKKDGVVGSFPLVETRIKKWFKELCQENNLDNPYNWRSSLPVTFVCDCAATELIQALKYYFSNRADIYSIKKGTILQMVDVVQSAISKNVIGIYDYGGYYDYTLNCWVNSENILAYQINSLIWNEKQTGYDPRIPNDVCDAFTYAIYFYYNQIENIVWLTDVYYKRKDYYNLRKNEL